MIVKYKYSPSFWCVSHIYRTKIQFCKLNWNVAKFWKMLQFSFFFFFFFLGFFLFFEKKKIKKKKKKKKLNFLILIKIFQFLFFFFFFKKKTSKKNKKKKKIATFFHIFPYFATFQLNTQNRIFVQIIWKTHENEGEYLYFTTIYFLWKTRIYLCTWEQCNEKNEKSINKSKNH